jgi:hypothetical protein
VIVWLPGGVAAEGELVEEREGGSSERSPLNIFSRTGKIGGGAVWELVFWDGKLGVVADGTMLGAFRGWAAPSCTGRGRGAGGCMGRRKAPADRSAGEQRETPERARCAAGSCVGRRKASAVSERGERREAPERARCGAGIPTLLESGVGEESGVGKVRKRGVSDRCGGGSGGSGGSRGCRR